MSQEPNAIPDDLRTDYGLILLDRKNRPAWTGYYVQRLIERLGKAEQQVAQLTAEYAAYREDAKKCFAGDAARIRELEAKQ